MQLLVPREHLLHEGRLEHIHRTVDRDVRLNPIQDDGQHHHPPGCDLVLEGEGTDLRMPADVFDQLQ